MKNPAGTVRYALRQFWFSRVFLILGLPLALGAGRLIARSAHSSRRSSPAARAASISPMSALRTEQATKA